MDDGLKPKMRSEEARKFSPRSGRLPIARRFSAGSRRPSDQSAVGTAEFADALSTFSCLLGILLLATSVVAQQPQPADAISVTTKDLPPATLWNPYSFRLEAIGGMEPYHWRAMGGALPRNLELRNSGEIAGVVNQQGQFDFTVRAEGASGTPSRPKRLTLTIEAPLKTDWSRKSLVTGNRIEGSIKVSNTTGRDFDLTFVVLAVNDIGRATAIGYQRFPLKKNTRDLELPFGDTLSPGSYVVNIDVVAEEPVSKMIFRTRLVTPKHTIAPTL